jgi:putative hemolysin
VLREYRNLPVLQLLWRAIAGYVADHRIELMFGCASLRGTDPAGVREQLAYLHHWHLAPEPLRPRVLPAHGTAMDVLAREAVDPRRAMRALEPMVKGYLRAGAWVGEGAWVDHDFNAIDVCIVMPTARLRRRHRDHFERAIQRPMLATAGVPEIAGPAPVAATARRA